MKHALLVALALAAGAAVADSKPTGYSITSLNTPDAVFVPSGNSMPISVTAPDSALRRATLLLNGHDVTSALAPSGPGTMSGTVVGLLPGINTFELLKNAKEKKPLATLKVAKAKPPVLACGHLVPRVRPAGAQYGDHLGHGRGGKYHHRCAGALRGCRHDQRRPRGHAHAHRDAAEPLHLRDQLAGASARRLEQQVPHAGRRRHRRQRAGHDGAASPRLRGGGERLRP